MTPSDYGTALACLTLQPDKVRAYEDDFVPEAAWRAVWKHWGPEATDFVYGHSFLLLKPETIARRLSWQAISFVVDRGFVPVAHAGVALSRNAAHHIWRFQWNAATTDRVELTNLVNAQSESLLILLRDSNRGPVPASVKLWRMKGSAHAERRTAEHLRTALGMHNRMLGFVHTPDEPADLVRELAILFDPGALDRLLVASRSVGTTNAEILAQSRYLASEFESRCRVHSVNPAEVVQRVGQTAGGRALSTVVSAMETGRRMGLAEVLASFKGAGSATCEWDALTIAAELIEHDKKGVCAKLDARAVGEMYARWSKEGAHVQGALRSECHA